jgi:hypothetical protein
VVSHILHCRRRNPNRYGFLAKIATTPTNELQFDVKYWATMIMSIIVSFMGAIGTAAPTTIYFYTEEDNTSTVYYSLFIEEMEGFIFKRLLNNRCTDLKTIY